MSTWTDAIHTNGTDEPQTSPWPSSNDYCATRTMPSRAPSACRKSGCPGLVRDGVCSHCGPLRRAHDRDLDQRRGNSRQAGRYDWRWMQARERYLAGHPLCEDCARGNQVTMATDVHHVVKLDSAPDLRLDDENMLALCRACHNKRTAAGE